ncbi:MAG: hypothetical protein AUJ96_05690 [Armatimonadetes bacterium CG2_30_66_41]|nr:MAG: hypothetical protein AUJ96_05690 [Armatimonadetes bacterium CG2_30_66_41]
MHTRSTRAAAAPLILPLLTAATILEAGAMEVTVRDHERRTIYHSPQTPGYTCWAGIWTMPDGSVLVSFTQATGPLEGWRQRAPKEILKRLPTGQQDLPAYDMTGLVQENLCLRSTDGGETWSRFSSDPFSSAMNGYSEGSVVVLADGTLLRAGWGHALTYCDVRPTGFLQRSTDGAKTWDPPEYLSPDPHLQTDPTRIRRLRDGRLIVTGGAAPFDPDKWRWMDLLPKTRHCLWISDDPAGKSWSGPVYVTLGADFACEEWDTAELENGDLLAVFRAITYDASGKAVRQDRRQSILTKRGDTWEPGPVSPTPFPHDGHPELLRTREGPILHVAPTAFSWTADRGSTWTKLDCPGTGYYPHATQLPDGTILAVGHTGSDDPYGKTDQAIVLNRFRLEVR